MGKFSEINTSSDVVAVVRISNSIPYMRDKVIDLDSYSVNVNYAKIGTALCYKSYNEFNKDIFNINNINGSFAADIAMSYVSGEIITMSNKDPEKHEEVHNYVTIARLIDGNPYNINCRIFLADINDSLTLEFCSEQMRKSNEDKFIVKNVGQLPAYYADLINIENINIYIMISQIYKESISIENMNVEVNTIDHRDGSKNYTDIINVLESRLENDTRFLCKVKYSEVEPTNDENAIDIVQARIDALNTVEELPKDENDNHINHNNDVIDVPPEDIRPVEEDNTNIKPDINENINPSNLTSGIGGLFGNLLGGLMGNMPSNDTLNT